MNLELKRDYIIFQVLLFFVFLFIILLYYIQGAFHLKSFFKILLSLVIIPFLLLTRRPFEYLAIFFPIFLCTGIRYVFIHKFLIKRTPPSTPLFLHITDFIAFALLFYILIQYISSKSCTKDPYFRFFGLFFGSLFLSLIPSFDKFFSLFHILMFFNGYIIYRFLLDNLEKRESNLRMFLWAYLVFLSFNIIIGVFQLVIGYIPLFGKGFMEIYTMEMRRIRGVFVHGNSLGGIIALTIPVYASFYFSDYLKKRRILVKFLYFSFFIFLLGALFFTYSRNSLISAFLGVLAVIFVYSWKIKRLRIFLRYGFVVFIFILIAVIISKFLFENVYERVVSIFSPYKDLSFQVRLHYWKNSLKTFFENPVLGVGISQFIYMPYAFLVLIPHNLYIQLLLETGILGFITFFMFIGYVLKSLFACVKIKEDKGYSWMVMGLVGSWVTFLSHNFLDSSWTTINHNEEMKVLFILITLSAFIYREFKKTSS